MFLGMLLLALTAVSSSKAEPTPAARCVWVWVIPILWYHNGEFLCPVVCPNTPGYMCCPPELHCVWYT